MLLGFGFVYLILPNLYQPNTSIIEIPDIPEVFDNMTNYEYNNYEDMGVNLSNSIANTHSIWELTLDYFYFVVPSQLKLYLFQVSTGTQTEIDIDPGDLSGDNKSRIQKIQSGWHDRANSIIWFVDCDNPSNDFDVWKLDYTSSKTSPTVTEIGTSSGADANTVFAGDIFIITGNVFVVNFEKRSTLEKVVVWEVALAPFTEKNVFNCDPFEFEKWYKGVVVGDKFYCVMEDLYSTNEDLVIMNYDKSDVDIDFTERLYDHIRPDNLSQAGMTYDGNDKFYFVVKKVADSQNYLTVYTISTDSFDVLGKYDVALMLDRNTDSTADPPNNLEKGFHISEDKIYQIPLNYSGNLNLISTFNFSDTIIAIIDHIVVDNSLNVYQYIDVMEHFTRLEITHDKEDYPHAKGMLRRDKITLTKNLFMQFTGKYSADQTTLNNQVVFEGKVQNKDGKKHQIFDCLGLGVEMTTVQPSGTISETTNDIIKAINAGSNSITNIPTYITDGTLSVGQSLVNHILEGEKAYKSIVNHFKDIDKFTWGLRPQGKIDYNNGTVFSGVVLRYNGNSFKNMIWNVNTFDLPTGVNRVEVKGAINTSTGVPYSGSWDEEELQQTENIKLFTISDASLDSNSLCNIAAQSIGERESTEITTVQFKVRDTTVGFPQPTQTIEFEYLSNDVNISLVTLIVDRVILDVKRDELFIEASTGLVFEYKRDSPLENLVEENSQLILQSARFVQGLQSDINALPTQSDLNAKISDIAYNQSTWNAVTTIAPSKNAVRDKFESLSSGISQSDFNAALMIGSANSEYIVCEYNEHSSTSRAIRNFGQGITNVGAGGPIINFVLPLSTNRGGKKLYIGGVKLAVLDADANNYVSLVDLVGFTYAGGHNVIDTNGTDYKTPQEVVDGYGTDYDVSGYDYIVVRVSMFVDTTGACNIGNPLLDCYYDD